MGSQTIPPFHLDRLGMQGIWGWGWCEPQAEKDHVAHLTNRERIQYSAMKSEKRKKEWLGARLALKRILEDINLVESPLNCETVKDEMGCPQVRIQERSFSRLLHCSSSHKGGLAAVCVIILAIV